MYELNVPVISELLLTVVLTGVLVFAFQKVLVERWLSRNLEQFRMDLQRTIQNESRQLHFIERQIEEFYSPMLGCLRKIQAKSMLRLEIEKASDTAWRKICDEHPKPFWDHEKYFEPFMKSIRYNNEELRKEIIPLYDEMARIFTGWRPPQHANGTASYPLLLTCGIDGLTNQFRLMSSKKSAITKISLRPSTKI